MKTVAIVASLIEALTILASLVRPTDFVEQSARLVGKFPFVSTDPTSYAYGGVIAFVCAVSGMIRLRSKTPVRLSTPKIAFNALIVTGAALMTYSIAKSAAQQTNIEEVVAPYFNYLLSVVVVVGVGNAIANLLTIFTFKE